MKLTTYVRIWLGLLAVLTYEFTTLHFAPHFSLLHLAQRAGVLARDADLSPAGGRTMSLWLGWLGIGIMLLTNLYILRKRLTWLRSKGRLVRWLDFHIFCGLLGPTLIVFHSDFHVRGLVAVSFWSMVVSFLSGIVGRYFYVQVLAQKAELEHRVIRLDEKLKTLGVTATGPDRDHALALAGVVGVSGPKGRLSLRRSLFTSLQGDFRLFFSRTLLAPDLSPGARKALVHYAVTRRRLLHLAQFQRLMGYWHAFHVPFAVFMYLVAAIHIVASLIMMT